jgi:carboxypeptidase C (cathepsin A)
VPSVVHILGTVVMSALAFSAVGAQDARSRTIGPGTDSHSQISAPLTAGDEPIVVSKHTIQSVKGPLTYEARVGRLPIRNAETGEVRGHIFFVAYVIKPKDGAPPRPLTFAWNGGPGAPSSIIHMQGLGPRRIDKDHMVDNPQTLLTASDLVFMDAMETGFSRPDKAEFEPEFFTLRGDVAATAEFIRAYRLGFRQQDQPVFIAGESYGVFRAAALADLMTDRGDPLDGAILISGDFPNVRQPVAFYDAMHVPARVAIAFHWKRLPPELMKDYAATMAQANAWVDGTYLPALEALDSLTAAEREKIAVDLARWIGMRPEQIDRKTLVVHAKHFIEDFFDGDKTQILDEEDARTLQDEVSWMGPPSLLDVYLRGELGYATNLTYSGLDKGYMPTPGPKFRSAGSQFSYDTGMPKADDALTNKTGDVTYIARDNPPWMQNAMSRNKTLKVFVATGRFDPLNMCEGDAKVTSQLPPDLSTRIQNKCYEGGHIMYYDPQVRPVFLADLARFIQDTVASKPKDKPLSLSGSN